jgi:hypothetical protein
MQPQAGFSVRLNPEGYRRLGEARTSQAGLCGPDWLRRDVLRTVCSPVSARGKRVQQPHAGTCKVVGVVRHHRQVVHPGNGSDLFVDLMLGIGDAQPAPGLCCVG